MATGKLTVSVAAIALMTAFAAPGEWPFISSAEAAGLAALAAEAQQHEFGRGSEENQGRRGDRESRGGRRGGGEESRGPRGSSSESRGPRGGGREGGWQGRQQVQQSAPPARPAIAREQRPVAQQRPGREIGGSDRREQWQARRQQVQQQGTPPQQRGQWQGRGDSDRRAQYQQRRDQAHPQGRPAGRDWQDRRQAQQGRPSGRDWQDRRQAQHQGQWQNRPSHRPSGTQWQGRPQHGQWQNRPQHHARPSYRHQRYNVRYSRSNAVRAPAVYHNHYYVNRYGRRNVHWTPPVRIVHHHVNYSGWTYNPRYHSNYGRANFYYTDGVCRPSGGNVAAGALVGALLGAAISDGDAGALLAGGLIGGGLGAALSDCDRGQYHYATHYAFSTGNPYYWHNPYSGVRGVVHARDFHNWGNQRCRWGDAEIFLPNGEVAYDRVRMCQDQYGYWQVARVQ